LKRDKHLNIKQITNPEARKNIVSMVKKLKGLKTHIT